MVTRDIDWRGLLEDRLIRAGLQVECELLVRCDPHGYANGYGYVNGCGYDNDDILSVSYC